MLYIVGLGLGDERDITLRGLEAVKRCNKIYIEAYTSLLSFGLSSDGLSRLEKFYGKTITVADREMVEEKADNILTEAFESDVAFLVVGDPFGATTHTDLVVRAKKLTIEVKVIHNASIMNAIGVCGLQLYRYGETVSIPFFTETWRPYSFHEKIQRNKRLGLHTLCLLDIRVKEPSIESLCRGRKCFEPPKFMTINVAIEQLLEAEEICGISVGAWWCIRHPLHRWSSFWKFCTDALLNLSTSSTPCHSDVPIDCYDENSMCVGLARLGCENQKIVAGSMKDLLGMDFGPPLHCLVIVGETHPVEEEMLEFYTIK